MDEHNFNIATLSIEMDISYQALYKYVKGISLPTGQCKQKILKYFGKSEYELFGQITKPNGQIVKDKQKEKEILSTNIQYLLDVNNITMSDFAKKINISYGDAISICGGIKLPSENLLIKIANVFNINFTDLFSKSLSKSILAEERKKSKLLFSANLRRAMELNSVTFNVICNDLNFPKSTMQSYLNGRAIPSKQRLTEIANYLSVSVSSLIEDPSVFDKNLIKKLLQMSLMEKKMNS